jgi:hypothetical protein
MFTTTDQKVSGLNPDGVTKSHSEMGGFFVGYQLVKSDTSHQLILYSPRKSKTMKRINFDFWGNENKSIQ